MLVSASLFEFHTTYVFYLVFNVNIKKLHSASDESLVAYFPVSWSEGDYETRIEMKKGVRLRNLYLYAEVTVKSLAESAV